MINKKNKILLVGAGYMAIEYAKVLKAMKLDFVVVGRSEKTAKSFKDSTGVDVSSGGIEKWLKEQKNIPRIAIVAVSVNQLANTTKKLISCGVSSVLLEKPGGLTDIEIKSVAKLAKQKKAKVYIAYNRRFYASAEVAAEIIKEDGGVKSFNFEFTEWSHQVKDLDLPKEIKENWFLANSTHVVDLAFFLGGKPKLLSTFKAGKLNWHPAGSAFAGAGVNFSGAPFSYYANWASPGRWGVEILTAKNRLIFRPLEKLQIQKIGSVAVEEVQINDRLDKEYKPGVYKQVEAFITNKKGLLTIAEQVENLKHYLKIIK